jgi:putative methylase
MGEPAQKRIIRKLDLELFLTQVTAQPSPSVQLEQYTTSPSIAATMLYMAAYANNDIAGKSVLDLGCGTGRLALGAAYLGAKNIVGIDIDRRAVKTAVENSLKVSLNNFVQWVLGDINAVTGKFDTVLQNPPFGVQIREADRPFIIKALEVGKTIYSLHNHSESDKRLIQQLKSSGGFLQVSPSPFLERFVANHGGVVKAVYAMLMAIPKMFEFHTKFKHDFVIDLYVIENKGCK